MLVKCKKCGQEKERILSGRFPSGAPRYIAQDGRIWHTAVCPDCHVKRHRHYQRKKYGVSPLLTIHCIMCGTQFEQKSIVQKYCCKKCKIKADYVRRRKIKDRINMQLKVGLD